MTQAKRLADQVTQRIVEVAERDPEAFVNGVEKAAAGASKLAQSLVALKYWATENPEEAKKAIRNAAISGVAKVVAKKRAEAPTVVTEGKDGDGV